MKNTADWGLRIADCGFALLIGLSLTGCARLKAKTAPDNLPLTVPIPPPRDVEPVEAEAPPPMSLPSEPARSPASRPRPAPPPAREQPRADAPKTEAPKPEPPQVVEPPKPDEPPKPAPTLQTTPATAEGAEGAIRATLVRATSDLNRVDYRALNADGRTQYDQAKSLLRQADDAVRKKNLVFAKSLADKAAALASQLVVK
jgi:hypothetical protein